MLLQRHLLRNQQTKTSAHTKKFHCFPNMTVFLIWYRSCKQNILVDFSEYFFCNHLFQLSCVWYSDISPILGELWAVHSETLGFTAVFYDLPKEWLEEHFYARKHIAITPYK